MNELHLFASLGGGLLASNLLGNNIVCVVERDERCQHVLVQRQNDRVIQPFPIWDDVFTFDGRPWRGTVDLVSSGISYQEEYNTKEGNRDSGKSLWQELLRVVRETCPAFVFTEVVSEELAISAKRDLEVMGYECESIKTTKTINKRYWILGYKRTLFEAKLCMSEPTESITGYFKPVQFIDNPEYIHETTCGLVGNEHNVNRASPRVAAEAFTELIKKVLS